MKVQKLDSTNFKDTIQNGAKPIIVDFYADWCGPCKMVAPIMEEIAGENEAVEVYKVNVDESPDIAAEFSIMSIPTVISFKEGKIHKTSVGAQPKNKMLDLIN